MESTRLRRSMDKQQALGNRSTRRIFCEICQRMVGLGSRLKLRRYYCSSASVPVVSPLDYTHPRKSRPDVVKIQFPRPPLHYLLNIYHDCQRFHRTEPLQPTRKQVKNLIILFRGSKQRVGLRANCELLEVFGGNLAEDSVQGGRTGNIWANLEGVKVMAWGQIQFF